MWDSLKKLPVIIEAGLYRLSQGMAVVAAVVVAGMMLLTVGDVGGRYFFNHPIKGTFELIGLLLVCAGTWGLGYCQMKKSHINITILVERFSRRIQAVFRALAYAIGLFGFGIVSWRMFILSYNYLTTVKGNVTDTLRVPYFPFMLMLALSTGVMSLALLFDLVHSITQAVRK